jgi:metal-responsive CopG/Arc/MetJ family transcriptional regulator
MGSDTVKILLALPVALKNEVDRAAQELGQTRSAFIRDRLARSLDHYDRRERPLIARLRETVDQ